VGRVAQLEPGLFAAVNALVEPVARAGLLSAPICPLGIVSLETRGRRSGKGHRVPVLAMSAGDYVLVATARGNRSDWFLNLEANPAVRYWLDGRERRARAVVLGNGGLAEGLPQAVAVMANAMTAHSRLLGWRFALLAPE
jgi:deazaflavin-dependent oxidoreductase (nitroreductase family)